MTLGLARKGFDGDLLDGVLAEGAFARLLLQGREFWEHKRDYQCAHTENIAIEYETSPSPCGQGTVYPSGIATCSAYWWIVEFAPERRVVLPTEDMKALARAAIREGRHTWGGDDNRFHNALVPFDWLRRET